MKDQAPLRPPPMKETKPPGVVSDERRTTMASLLGQPVDMSDIPLAAGAPTQAEFNAFVTSYNALLAAFRGR